MFLWNKTSNFVLEHSVKLYPTLEYLYACDVDNAKQKQEMELRLKPERTALHFLGASVGYAVRSKHNQIEPY